MRAASVGILHDDVRDEIITLREMKMGHCVRQQWRQLYRRRNHPANEC